MVLQGWSARATTPIDMNTPHDTGGNAPSSTTDQRAPSLLTPDGTDRDSSESPTLIATVKKQHVDWKKRAMIVDDPKVAGRDHPIIIHVGRNVPRGRACGHPSRCWPAPRVQQLLSDSRRCFWTVPHFEPPRTPARPQAMRYLVQSGHAKHIPGKSGRLDKLKLATVTLLAALETNPDFNIGDCLISPPSTMSRRSHHPAPQHFHLERVPPSPCLPPWVGPDQNCVVAVTGLRGGTGWGRFWCLFTSAAPPSVQNLQPQTMMNAVNRAHAQIEKARSLLFSLLHIFPAAITPLSRCPP